MKLSGLPPQGLLHSLQPGGKQAPRPQSANLLPEQAQQRRQDALQLVERTLAKGYEQLQAKAGKSASFKAFEPLTAEKVADNILGFIERRLKLDAADGATPEQLEARLEAGLAGFKKGFAEAEERLKALSMLTPEIAQDIGQTYDLVLKGIEALRERFVPGGSQQPTERDTTTQTAIAETRAQALGALAQGNYQYAVASRFSFELLTAEGDKVTISAASSQAFAVRGGAGAAGTGSSQFNWSVEGELNDDEQAALEQLLGQVNQLAERFFQGDLDGAFAQALQLNYDSSQIVSFALNLTQVEVQRVSAAYQEVGGANTEGLTRERLLPLGNFVRELLDTLDSARAFAEPEALLLTLSEKMLADQRPDSEPGQAPGERFRQFVEQVLESLAREQDN